MTRLQNTWQRLGFPIFMTEKEDLNSQAGCIGCGSKTSFNVAFNAEIGVFFAQEGGLGEGGF